jgi:hypothetical protein
MPLCENIETRKIVLNFGIQRGLRNGSNVIEMQAGAILKKRLVPKICIHADLQLYGSRGL